MPFVLLRLDSRQVFTCMLVNHYNLEYYGVKFWEDREEAELQYAAFLLSKGILEGEASQWSVSEMEENRMKICNVKLKNDPGKLLFWDEDGTIKIQNK